MSRTAVVIMLLLLATNAMATQISPAKKTTVLNTGSTTEYSLRIINDQRQNLQVAVQVQGPLAQDIVILPETFSLDEFENDREVTVQFNHPREDLLTPGHNQVQILVSAKTLGNQQFASAVTLAHNLDIIRLYDGAYLESTLRVSETKLALSLSNLGKVPTIARANATIYDNSQSFPLNLGSIAVPPNANTKLEATLPDLAPGEYNATANLTYKDPLRGTVNNIQRITFRNKAPVLRYAGIIGNFVPDQIVELTLPVTVRWNKPIQSYTDFSLLSQDSLLVQQRTPTRQLLPKVKNNITGYLDLNNIPEGNYTIVAATYSAGLLVGERQEQITIRYSNAKSIESHRTFAMITFALILAILALAILALLGRKK